MPLGKFFNKIDWYPKCALCSAQTAPSNSKIFGKTTITCIVLVPVWKLTFDHFNPGQSGGAITTENTHKGHHWRRDGSCISSQPGCSHSAHKLTPEWVSPKTPSSFLLNHCQTHTKGSIFAFILQNKTQRSQEGKLSTANDCLCADSRQKSH